MDTKLLDTEKYFQSFEEEKPTYDYLLWEQGVGGSNPLTPTDGRVSYTDIKPFFIEGLLFYQKYSGLYHTYTI